MRTKEECLRTIQGTRVRHVREAKDFSQQQFAEKLGISQQALGKIELGKSVLTQRNYNEICRIFNVNPVWLEKGEGEIFKPEPEENFLDKLANEMKLSFRQKALLQSIIDLPPQTRDAVIDWALDLAEKITEEEIKLENAAELKRRELLKQRRMIDEEIAELERAEKIKKKELVCGKTG